MNGCQYTQRTFTLPAGSAQISQMKWDLAFMSRKEFIEKYDMSARMYEEMTKGA